MIMLSKILNIREFSRILAVLGTLMLVISPAKADLDSAELDETQANELMRDIIILLKSRGGRASTSFVIDAFQDRVQSHQHALFRKLLKLAANLERAAPSTREGAASFWVIKPEFADL